MAWIEFDYYRELWISGDSHLGAHGFMGRFASVQAAIRQNSVDAERAIEEREAQRLASIIIQEREFQSRKGL